MGTVIKSLTLGLLYWLVLIIPETGMAQTGSIKLGAYYFDGWTGVYPYHITQSLVKDYSSRRPIWGWVTSNQATVDAQIQVASDAGISFFAFCWYYNGQNNLPLNNALSLYKKSRYKDKLKYCLLITNHSGFSIQQKDWPALEKEWVSNFKSDNYQTFNHKPLIIFYSFASMIKEFGSPGKVKVALDSLRAAAKAEGIANISIAACTIPDEKSLQLVEECGFDLLTGYNYHDAGFSGGKIEIPIDSLQTGEYRVWNRFAKNSGLRYVPSVTLNWDPRPWANKVNNYDTKPYYVGFSPKSVQKSIGDGMRWVKNDPKAKSGDRIVLLYAWNEYGEGAYLTPSEGSKNGALDAIKRVNLTNSN